jgi:hypothetical protein
MKRNNPIAARVLPLAGRQLPPDWQQQAAQNRSQAYDQRDLENMWRTPEWSAKINAENVQREARLTRHPSWDELLGER